MYLPSVACRHPYESRSAQAQSELEGTLTTVAVEIYYCPT
jgi:hypothetical protein